MTLQTNDKIKRSQDIKISSVVIMVMLDMGKEFVLNNTYMNFVLDLQLAMKQ